MSKYTLQRSSKFVWGKVCHIMLYTDPHTLEHKAKNDPSKNHWKESSESIHLFFHIHIFAYRMGK